MCFVHAAGFGLFFLLLSGFAGLFPFFFGGVLSTCEPWLLSELDGGAGRFSGLFSSHKTNSLTSSGSGTSPAAPSRVNKRGSGLVYNTSKSMDSLASSPAKGNPG